jgi:putative peptidoglycan lipid II flippase
VVGSATLLSRILGFLRDLVVARAFGAGPLTDSFFVAFRLPNLLRRLVAEGALSSAFIPVFSEYLATREAGETRRMLRAVGGAVALVLGGITLAGILAAPLLVRVMAPGFFADPARGALTVGLTRLMFPYLFFVGLAALAMGILNAHRRFFTPALAPVALNVAMIAAVLFLAPHLERPVFGLAVGVVVGGLGQLLVQVPALHRGGLLVSPAFEPDHPAVRRCFRLMAPVVVGQSANQLNVLVNTMIASFLGGGSVSYLYYADRLVEFPQGVFGIAIATAVLPTLSEHAARRELTHLRQTLSFALRLAAFIGLPAAIGLFLLREPIVRVLYQRGQFGAVEAAGTAAAVGYYALGLLGWGGAKICAQAFYALGDTRTPVKVAVGSMVLNSLLALALVRPLAHAGLALASAAAGTVNAVVLVWLLGRRLPPEAGAAGREGWTRLVLGSVALAIALAGALRLWPAPGGRGAEALWLVVMIAGSVALYTGLHALLRTDEARLMWSVARRRLKAIS